MGDTCLFHDSILASPKDIMDKSTNELLVESAETMPLIRDKD